MRLLLEWHFWLEALTSNKVVQNSYKIRQISKMILIITSYFQRKTFFFSELMVFLGLKNWEIQCQILINFNLKSAPFKKQMFSNFPKERTQAIMPTVSYCSAKNYFALELNEQMTFNVFWDGEGGGTGWVSESYCTIDRFLHIGEKSSERQDWVRGESGFIQSFASWKIL